MGIAHHHTQAGIEQHLRLQPFGHVCWLETQHHIHLTLKQHLHKAFYRVADDVDTYSGEILQKMMERFLEEWQKCISTSDIDMPHIQIVHIGDTVLA